MLKKISLVFIIVVLRFLPCSGQCYESDQLKVQQITASAFTNYYTQYDGSPFFNEKWYKASLKLSSGEIYKELEVGIDIYEDELIYYNAVLRKYLTVDKHIIDEVYLENAKGKPEYIVKNIYTQNSDNQSEYSFYFIHVDDSISLWSKQNKGLFLDNSTSARKTKYFGDKTKYYVVINGEKTSIPLLKKSIAKMFPQNKQAIISYINQYKLNLKNPRHLSFLFQRINELEKSKPGNKKQGL